MIISDHLVAVVLVQIVPEYRRHGVEQGAVGYVGAVVCDRGDQPGHGQLAGRVEVVVVGVGRVHAARGRHGAGGKI